MDGAPVKTSGYGVLVKKINNFVKNTTCCIESSTAVVYTVSVIAASFKLKEIMVMTFDKIRDLIVEQLDVDPSMVTMDTDFMKDLEADSLDAVEIILGVEEEYGIEIPDEVAENFTKVGDIVKYVDKVK